LGRDRSGWVTRHAVAAPAEQGTAGAIQTVPGMPTVVDPANLYSETAAGRIRPDVAKAPPRVYVPNRRSNDVSVIDPATMQVVDRFPVGVHPQHVVPSWDLKTLWVTNNAEKRFDGTLTPIDPMTGKPGKPIEVDNPYNMYFTPDGRSAVVVAEARKRLDFRHPQTMELQYQLSVPDCPGINHGDFSIDGRYAIFTCEFARGVLAKIDFVERKVLGYLKLSQRGMPQDIRISPDGGVFYVADMHAGGVFVVDGERFVELEFIRTGAGAHGLYPSRDATKLYVVNRGTSMVYAAPGASKGSITVIDFATRKIVAHWPTGGSPDMGNVSADGRILWLSGRFDDVVYAIDTETGMVMRTIKVGAEPHGLTVWPQPGRYSLGHTGNLR
jgi:YVTN family beta-propeller protein